MGAVFNEITARIASGQSLSGVVMCGSGIPVAVEMPSQWTAASLTFQGSVDGSNFYDIADTNGIYELNVGANQHVAMDAAFFAGVRFLKVRSGTPTTPVAQGADRDIRIIARKEPRR